MQESPLLLSLDTATKCSSVSLTRGSLEDGQIVAHLSLNSDITHSRRLIKSVEILFEETGTNWPAVAAVAVGLGPGSFTGLRIGMATAKGFASAAGIKLLGVSTLDGLAAMCVTEKKICAVMDARKKQVYTAYYQHNEEGKLRRIGDIRVLAPEILAEEIAEPVLMVGDGTTTYGEMWKGIAGEHLCFAPPQLHAPSAAAIGLLCGKLYQQGKFLDISSASPVYVRASDAELSLADKKKAKMQS